MVAREIQAADLDKHETSRVITPTTQSKPQFLPHALQAQDDQIRALSLRIGAVHASQSSSCDSSVMAEVGFRSVMFLPSGWTSAHSFGTSVKYSSSCFVFSMKPFLLLAGKTCPFNSCPGATSSVHPPFYLPSLINSSHIVRLDKISSWRRSGYLRTTLRIDWRGLLSKCINVQP